MSKKFEHRAEYVAIPFKAATSGTWIFKATEQTLEPDVDALLAKNEHLQSTILKLGTEGWELVSTQPLYRGEIKNGNQNAQAWSYGFAMPIGYLLFFKRESSYG
ncbi:hypothetical protein [Pseudomonas asiatica]|uniref:DUF4177 domain-containing protein n=1 Tax=Pseudomonas asiatica TaxID=2219225 RepID=A0ABU5KVV6_9PSED|nr:hypothetical protein [Pseudomonas asiatica]MDZ5738054.1 hypothetical protein [Pseudomonas asiatica]MDZ5744650.1 hypothetical protein [Pseudomonas asiatica]MDZ5748810.1 hypothetical protein [Pseudomonas asiatica]MDZ5753142.1 hypothetical protein [Pseudomonas asiatica]